MADVDVLSDITRKARHQIDHSKVVVCYNSSLAGDEAKADAYIAARSLDTNHKYAVALGAAGARTQATIWSTWASDLADYCETNNIEAICCTPGFDAGVTIAGLGYSNLVSGSRFLGSVVNLKALGAATGLDPLATSPAAYYTDRHFVNMLKSQPDRGFSNPAGSILDVATEDVLGVASGDTLELNSVASTAFAGLRSGSIFAIGDEHLTYRGDISATWTTLPSWRIGWYDITAGVLECTPAKITAMVERAIASEVSIGAHKHRPIVCGSRDRGVSRFSVGAPIWNDILYEELGFTNRKWGWAEGSMLAGELDPATSGSVPEATGYSRYDKNDGENYVGFVLRTSAPADTSASVYRNTRSEYGSPSDYHWEALNDTTFPIPVFGLHDQLLTNITSGTDSLQFKPGEAIQVFDVQDGAYAYFATSAGLRSGNTFIEYGGCAAFGSYFEPLASQVRSDGVWTKALLQGYSASQAALFAQNQKLLHAPELIGDGLYQPYKYEASSVKRQTNMNYLTYGQPEIYSQDTGDKSWLLGVFYTINMGTGVTLPIASFGGQRERNNGVAWAATGAVFDAAAKTITHTGIGDVWRVGDRIAITGTTSNNVTVTVKTSASGVITVNETLTNETSNATLTQQYNSTMGSNCAFTAHLTTSDGTAQRSLLQPAQPLLAGVALTGSIFAGGGVYQAFSTAGDTGFFIAIADEDADYNGLEWPHGDVWVGSTPTLTETTTSVRMPAENFGLGVSHTINGVKTTFFGLSDAVQGVTDLEIFIAGAILEWRDPASYAQLHITIENFYTDQGLGLGTGTSQIISNNIIS